MTNRRVGTSANGSPAYEAPVCRNCSFSICDDQWCAGPAEKLRRQQAETPSAIPTPPARPRGAFAAMLGWMRPKARVG